MKMLYKTAAVLAGAFLLTGCASIEQAYIPDTIGPLQDHVTDGTLRISISTFEDTAYIGDPIVFTVSIRNIGEKAIWFPRNPDLLFIWTYPNGNQDNFLRDFQAERFYSKADAVLLRPGQQMTKSVVIKTYYFPRTGVTEFRAVLHAGRNTNPALKPFWHGEVESNAYGVMVRKGKKKDTDRYSMRGAVASLK